MSQEQKIINWLLPPGRKIDPLKALKKFNCFRLASRMYAIRELGYPVKSEIVRNKKTGKHYSRYFFS